MVENIKTNTITILVNKNSKKSYIFFEDFRVDGLSNLKLNTRFFNEFKMTSCFISLELDRCYDGSEDSECIQLVLKKISPSIGIINYEYKVYYKGVEIENVYNIKLELMSECNNSKLELSIYKSSRQEIDFLPLWVKILK